ncbi:MAG: aromatic aminobenezylarsenical efflux permease ArsG family transporter [Vulcanimicrobiota bacterium]
MNEWYLGVLTAFWLGILTSISPCPLATNIAATSYIGKKIGCSKSVLFSGLLYTTGRILTYTVLGILLVSGIASSYVISNFLQNQMNKILGPLLIVTGMFLLELISINISGPQMNDRMKEKIEKLGIWGGLVLGIFFALSFCPVSAALFFGSLLPIAVKINSKILIPLVYGLGTGLPVVVFAILLAFSVKSAGKIFNKINVFDVWARKITGIIFILVGIYYSLEYIFEII